MAVENKRMQQRYGTYSQFQADMVNLLPNEFVSVTADDPNTTSGKALYFNPESGEPYRLLTNEDKANIDADIQQLQSTSGVHTQQIEALNLQMPNKIELSDLADYTYSKEAVDARVSSGFVEISTVKFAGKPCYSWAKLGHMCIMVIDTPICTAADASLTIPLPFPPVRDVKLSLIVAGEITVYELTANAATLDITNIPIGSTVSGTFAYRVGAGS